VRRLTAAPVLGSLLVLLAALACEDTGYRRIGAEINVLVKRSEGVAADGARQRLIGLGPRAIPQIETALHTAPLRGRLHLVAALEAIGDSEAVPILRHFAIYDSSDQVRAACEAILNGWAAGADTRSARARVATARVTDLRRKGEGPTPMRP
jgi:hypothetical protein